MTSNGRSAAEMFVRGTIVAAILTVLAVAATIAVQA